MIVKFLSTSFECIATEHLENRMVKVGKIFLRKLLLLDVHRQDHRLPSTCFLALPFGAVGDVLATKDPDLDDEEEETHVYEKHDKLLHGSRKERK